MPTLQLKTYYPDETPRGFFGRLLEAAWPHKTLRLEKLCSSGSRLVLSVWCAPQTAITVTTRKTSSWPADQMTACRFELNVYSLPLDADTHVWTFATSADVDCVLYLRVRAKGLVRVELQEIPQVEGAAVTRVAAER